MKLIGMLWNWCRYQSEAKSLRRFVQITGLPAPLSVVINGLILPISRMAFATQAKQLSKFLAASQKQPGFQKGGSDRSEVGDRVHTNFTF
jgi:hypothetical protein